MASAGQAGFATGLADGLNNGLRLGLDIAESKRLAKKEDEAIRRQEKLDQESKARQDKQDARADRQMTLAEEGATREKQKFGIDLDTAKIKQQEATLDLKAKELAVKSAEQKAKDDQADRMRRMSAALDWDIIAGDTDRALSTIQDLYDRGGGDPAKRVASVETIPSGKGKIPAIRFKDKDGNVIKEKSPDMVKAGLLASGKDPKWVDWIDGKLPTQSYLDTTIKTTAALKQKLARLQEIYDKAGPVEAKEAKAEIDAINQQLKYYEKQTLNLAAAFARENPITGENMQEQGPGGIQEGTTISIGNGLTLRGPDPTSGMPTGAGIDTGTPAQTSTLRQDAPTSAPTPASPAPQSKMTLEQAVKELERRKGASLTPEELAKVKARFGG